MTHILFFPSNEYYIMYVEYMFESMNVRNCLSDIYLLHMYK